MLPTSRYNIVGSLGATAGAFTGRVTVRHNAGLDIPAGLVVGQEHVRSYTLADLFLSLDIGKLTSLGDTSLNVTVLNIFDRDPPYYGAQPVIGTIGGYTNGGTLGRTFGIGLQTKF